MHRLLTDSRRRVLTRKKCCLDQDWGFRVGANAWGLLPKLHAWLLSVCTSAAACWRCVLQHLPLTSTASKHARLCTVQTLSLKVYPAGMGCLSQEAKLKEEF